MSKDNHDKLLMFMSEQFSAIREDIGELKNQAISIEKKVDYTNGTNREHAEEINVIKLELAEKKGASKLASGIWGSISGAVVGLVIWIIQQQGK